MVNPETYYQILKNPNSRMRYQRINVWARGGTQIVRLKRESLIPSTHNINPSPESCQTKIHHTTYFFLSASVPIASEQPCELSPLAAPVKDFGREHYRLPDHPNAPRTSSRVLVVASS